MQFEQIGWDGEGDLPGFQEEWLRSSPIVFFQLPPPPKLLANMNARLVWIPMWDQARGYDSVWWQKLPKHLKVVAFSDEVEKRAKIVGLPSMRIKFYKNPDEMERVNWSERRVLLYWNRVGLVGPAFLEGICKNLEIDQLLFIHRIDPLIPAWFDYSLPKILGNTPVRQIPITDFIPLNEYAKIVNQANIFISPRSSEGVGLTFIEALARGCAVFAYDAPTMNEYIKTGVNGYLLPGYGVLQFGSLREQVRNKVLRFRAQHINKEPYFEHAVTEWQDWESIRKLDLDALGDSARREQAIGFAKWKASILNLAHFILDW
jgi:glycosyltransferase involved in cell wall biosynthesis